jgi:hypothetical protein
VTGIDSLQQYPFAVLALELLADAGLLQSLTVMLIVQHLFCSRPVV